MSDVELSSEVTIGRYGTLYRDLLLIPGYLGEYRTTLNYNQNGVATGTDDTLDYILPVLAQPIVQKIVTGSVLGYPLTFALMGQITNDSPGSTRS